MASSAKSSTTWSCVTSARRSPACCVRRIRQRTPSSSATTCATARPASRRPSPTASPPRASTSSRSAWPAPTCSTSPPAPSTCPARCSPRATTRPSTTASSCAAPGAARSARTPASPSIRAAVEAGVRARRPGGGARHTERDLLADYAAYLRSLVDLTGIRPLKVVVDAGNGMGGYTVPAVLARTCRCRRRAAVLRARRHLPQPRGQPARPGRTSSTCRQRVVEDGADLGLAFDGDADRCFVVDERGEPVSPSAITALVAVRELAKAPRAAAVIHNLITSRAVPEIIARARRPPGAHPRRALVHQGRDGRDRRDLRRRALGALLLPRLLARRHRHARRPARAGRARRAGRPLSELVADYDRYVASGEINSTVADQAAATAAVRAAFADRGATFDELDGLTVALARRVLVQPARLQHRAAAAAQRRGRRRGRDGGAARRGAGDRPGVRAAEKAETWQSLRYPRRTEARRGRAA